MNSFFFNVTEPVKRIQETAIIDFIQADGQCIDCKIAPLLVVIGLLRLIDAFKVFDTVYILTGGGPGISTETPSILANKMTFEFWNIGEASALAVLVWIAFFVFCNIFYQVAKKRLNAF